MYLIVGALFGSTSTSDQPHDFCALLTAFDKRTGTLPPKKTSNRESKRTISIGYLTCLKANRKNYLWQDLTQDVIGTITLDSTRDICLPVRALYLE